jgi:hypothetical protein
MQASSGNLYEEAKIAFSVDALHIKADSLHHCIWDSFLTIYGLLPALFNTSDVRERQ